MSKRTKKNQQAEQERRNSSIGLEESQQSDDNIIIESDMDFDEEDMVGSSGSQGEDFQPGFESIQRKAYELYEQRGGNDFDNWIEAERILKSESRSKK